MHTTVFACRKELGKVTLESWYLNWPLKHDWGFCKQEGQDIVFQAQNHREKAPRTEKTHVQPKCQTPGTCERNQHRTDVDDSENLDSVRLRVEAGQFWGLRALEK